MILGHLGCSYIISKKVFKSSEILMLCCCVFGGYFPDLIDKPLALLGISQGRGYGHSMVFLIGGFLFSRMVVERFRKYANAFITCFLFHVICDFVNYKVLFWPLFGPMGVPEAKYHMLEKVYRFYTFQSHIVFVFKIYYRVTTYR